MAAPPGGADRKTTVVNRKALDTGEQRPIYGLDIDSLKFDVGAKKLARGSSHVPDDSLATLS